MLLIHSTSQLKLLRLLHYTKDGFSLSYLNLQQCKISRYPVTADAEIINLLFVYIFFLNLMIKECFFRFCHPTNLLNLPLVLSQVTHLFHVCYASTSNTGCQFSATNITLRCAVMHTMI